MKIEIQISMSLSKILLEPSPTHLVTDYPGLLCAVITELSSFKRAHMAHKTKATTICPLQKKFAHPCPFGSYHPFHNVRFKEKLLQVKVIPINHFSYFL